MSDYVGFGKYLKHQRERRGLSVDEVAGLTKISPTLVSALEEGQAERLPARVFMLNYVRSYAVVVGLPADEAVERYQSMPSAPKAEAFDPVALEAARRETALTAWWVLAALLCAGGLAFAWSRAAELALRYANR